MSKGALSLKMKRAVVRLCETFFTGYKLSDSDLLT